MSAYLTGSSRRYGDRFVFLPLLCATGNRVDQPEGKQLQDGAMHAFTADYKVDVDLRGALDAPYMLPSGGIRAHVFGDAAGNSLQVAHVYRDGWHE